MVAGEQPGQRWRWGNFGGGVTVWAIATGAIALLVAIPILAILVAASADSGAVWQHLAATVLPLYIRNSLALMLGVGFGVALLGTTTAWLIACCQFPGRRWFSALLLLPLAAPAYLLAYTYTEFLEFYGPLQTGLRQLFSWQSAQDYWFPPIRSLGGAIALLILVLYPYVYLLARVAFREQSARALEASRCLGCGAWESFWRVALPLARPAIAAGTALALMETLSDFGTVEYFGVPTFTTGIYRTWLGLGERLAAAQLAACLMGFIAVLLGLEAWSRRQARYYQTAARPLARYLLRGGAALLAMGVCALPVLLGFGLPTGLLLILILRSPQQLWRADFLAAGQHSLILASLAALLAVLLAAVLAYGQRVQPSWGLRIAVRIASLGYAVPGSAIAVGVLVPIGRLDNFLAARAEAWFGLSTGLLLSGTIAALVFAYLVRFLAVALKGVSASLGRIAPSLDEAARSLGRGPTGVLLAIHAPLLRGSLVSAAMLVFVDTMKELPATLVIRPFNFDTLAVRVYQYASDERLAEAAAPALAIILVGLLPTLLLNARSQRSEN
ncbi:MAG: iron ABC transporter permease [Spirulinaceae cyanobacterium SM2_1_0]|nr:iron ABC transporter permease [Spirulinaceae cyanobacterium SM2_1_0]